MEINPIYMRRALELARHGQLDASPNPMVGAVIVDNRGQIIGEGWHRRCGEGHAEVNAIASVKNEELLRDATMYVTLEPCAHYGKTPPCARLIVDKRIPRVVVGCVDPFAKVSGKGIAILREAGVEVAVGILEEECRELNEKFMTAHTMRRPYITLKWAESADGFIDGHISTPLTSVAVHRLRALHDAILVGSGTWIADNPSLTTRCYAGKSPRRMVLDRRGKLSVPDDVIVLRDYPTLTDACSRLYSEYGVTSLLVEGGAKVLQAFIDEGLYDVIRVEHSTENIHGKVKSPRLPNGINVESVINLGNHKIITLK
ncbi:MAG: bifunctional diaminohydroxyphosphoribosylaminopyrimidine deaminase/5-amino-6-(5-phosphoribosylamino)uracil reductase RibD [Muribaculaceae bacterium]|nr:bifunctional diaminohydroxyphosphoribosylaminopyrimidine deaminase/5-amino-6-(5-phosphoribosylamino)uracil reductase RibD [Muribaculaceae bacterium]